MSRLTGLAQEFVVKLALVNGVFWLFLFVYGWLRFFYPKGWRGV